MVQMTHGPYTTLTFVLRLYRVESSSSVESSFSRSHLNVKSVVNPSKSSVVIPLLVQIGFNGTLFS